MILNALSDRITNNSHYAPGGAFVAQALTADSLEAATETNEITPVEDVLGVVMRFLFVTFSDGDPELDARVPFFAVVDAVRSDTGDKVTFTCGGERVLATLVRAVELDWLPFDASITEVKLGGARRALNIVPAPQKVTNTSA